MIGRIGLSAVVFASTFLIAGLLVAQSEVPQVVNIQGFLVDDQGDPVDGTVSMIFDLYDAQLGGNLIHRVGPMVVEVQAGVYSAGLSLTSADFSGASGLKRQRRGPGDATWAGSAPAPTPPLPG